MRLLSFLVALAASVCFLGGVILRPGPLPGPKPAAPDALAVRQGFNLLEIVMNLGDAPAPVPIHFGPAQLDAVERLLAHVSDRVVVSGGFQPGVMHLGLSRKVARQSWLNLAVAFGEAANGGAPRMAVKLGALWLPAPATQAALRFLPAVGTRLTGQPVPPYQTMIPRFRATPAGADMQLKLPGGALAMLPMLVGGTGTPVKLDSVWHAYALELAASTRDPHRDFATMIRDAAARAKSPEQLGATMVAMAMTVVGPGARRLSGDRGKGPPCRPEVIATKLAGRADWPRHWAMSAALGAVMGPRATRAIGLWKELDDSLPGGSGFSWADLGADMAGATIGIAARDPEQARLALNGLKTATDASLLPTPVTKLPEGTPNARYRQLFGGIEMPASRGQEARITRLLKGSPLYRPLL